MAYTQNSIFLQPQGNVYFVSNKLEAGNLPFTQNGVSVGICFEEGLMYLKGLQNGNQILSIYDLSPHNLMAQEDYNGRLEKVEEKLNVLINYLSKPLSSNNNNNTNQKQGEGNISDLI